MFKVFSTNKKQNKINARESKATDKKNEADDCPMCHISPATVKALQPSSAPKQKDYSH
ncbi:MAG: hypothetical protein Q8Q23_05945 [bacterium]|nr:hypothetical protein [bacterium]